MRSNRLGCLSGMGMIIILVTLLAIGGVTYAEGGRLYSSGLLNAQAGEMLGGVRSHAETGGQCEACHTAPWSSVSMAKRCIDCHGEIALQMQDMVALHGVMYQSNPKLECRDCHPEHRGADAPLTVMEGAEFPHELLGFSLNGHRRTVQKKTFTCTACHQENISTFATDSCDACHRQIDPVFAQAHLLSYGTACLDCHDGVDRFGQGFNHNVTQFKLLGRHQKVACVLCHVGARQLADFTTAPQDCYACHRTDDPHEARFGADCGVCHTATSWIPASFDHNLSAFRLEGKHARVACESCHRGGVYQGTPTDCYACHQQDDEHNGQFGTDCAACHTPKDWEDVTFDHNMSDFPLDGAHVTVACEDCHSTGQFAGLTSQCVSCHADPDFHFGAFSTNCTECHSTTAWSPANFNNSHPEPRVDEEGTGVNHGYTTCRTCHPSTVQSYTCLACHSDNLGGEGSEGDDD